MSPEPLRDARAHAVLIGNSKYKDSVYPPIPAAANSVDGLFALLTDPNLGGWSADQITVIRDARANGRLAQRLRQIACATTGPLLLYFVGHGAAVASGELCLILTDTDGEDADLTGLEYTKIKRILLESPAVVKVVILDCCYSGRAIEALGADGSTQLAQLSDVRGVYTLTAADSLAHVGSRDQQATAPTSFTGELLALARAGLPDGREHLTFADLYPYLRRQLAARDLPRPNQSGTDTASQFVFTRNAAWRSAETRAPASGVGTAPVDTSAVGRFRSIRAVSALTRSHRARLAIALFLVVLPVAVAIIVFTRPGHFPVNVATNLAQQHSHGALVNYPTRNCAAARQHSTVLASSGAGPADDSASILPSPAHCWPLDSAAAGPVGTVADAAGGGLTLHSVGGVSWHSGDRFSPDALFDGARGELSAHAPGLSLSRDFSIAFWAKPTSYADGVVVAQDGSNAAGFLVYVNSRDHDWTFAMAYADGPGWPFDFNKTGPPVQLNTWTQITATYDQSGMALYVNGVLSFKIPHAPLNGFFTGNFNIGADYLVGNPSGTHFTGQIANVQVWQVCLTPTQVAALAASKR